ncbi:hypothetical protein V6N13_022030 [Hibiscus sabdariffa]
MVTMGGEWNWEAFQRHLPTHVLLQIAAIKCPVPSFANDSIGWKLRVDHQFSVKSAYEDEMWGSIIGRSKWFAQMTATARNSARAQVVRNSNAPASGAAPPCWQPPDLGWLKFNVDGARNTVDGSSACGGVLRDHHGTWIIGFTKYVGRCSVVEAELWGIASGMEVAWSLNCRRLVVESDSAEALAKVARRDNFEGQLTLLRSAVENGDGR